MRCESAPAFQKTRECSLSQMWPSPNGVYHELLLVCDLAKLGLNAALQGRYRIERELGEGGLPLSYCSASRRGSCPES